MKIWICYDVADDLDFSTNSEVEEEVVVKIALNLITMLSQFACQNKHLNMYTLGYVDIFSI